MKDAFFLFLFLNKQYVVVLFVVFLVCFGGNVFMYIYRHMHECVTLYRIFISFP